MAPYQSKLTSFLTKVEVTEGTDTVPTASDGLFARVSQPTVVAAFLANEQYAGKGSKLPGQMAARRFEAQIEQTLRGAGAAYAAGVKPKADSLLRACGFLAAGSYTGGSEKYDYTFKSDTFESFSSYIYLAGKLHKFLGCRGLPTLKFALGGFATLSAQLKAWYTLPTDAALTAVTGEATTAYPVMLASAFQIGTENFAAKHGDITIDCGRTIVPREDGTAASGYAGMEMLGDRTPKITFECEATNEAGHPFFTKLMAGTQMDCSFQVGTTQYNRIKVTIPVMQFESLAYGDKSGIVTYRATCALVSAGGLDDEMTLTFD